MRNFYLIVGESGSGKTCVGKELEDHYDMHGVKSYTTRPPRSEDESGYYFVSKEKFKTLPDIVESTEYNGNLYGTTANEIDKGDFDIVDPKGIRNFRENYKGKKTVFVIYLRAPEFMREKRMLERGDTKEDAQARILKDKDVFKGVSKLADIVIDNDGRFSDCVKQVVQEIQKCEVKDFVLRVPFRVLFDLDNVLENLVQVWIRLLNVKHGLHVKMENLTEYQVEKAFPMLTRQEVYEPLNSDEFLYLLEPIPGSVDCLKQLIEEGFDVGICTMTHYKGIGAKSAMINYYFGMVGWSHVTITGEKKYVACDVLVDDFQGNFIDAPFSGLLVNYPWNTEFKADNVTRVFTFDDVIREIHRLADEKAERIKAKEISAI